MLDSFSLSFNLSIMSDISYQKHALSLVSEFFELIFILNFVDASQLVFDVVVYTKTIIIQDVRKKYPLWEISSFVVKRAFLFIPLRIEWHINDRQKYL
jgi:hypothetical protein